MTTLVGSGITGFTYMRLRACLKLEIHGMTVSRGPSAAAQIRKLIGSKTRDKIKLLVEFNDWLRKEGWISSDGRVSSNIAAKVVS